MHGCKRERGFPELSPVWRDPEITDTSQAKRELGPVDYVSVIENKWPDPSKEARRSYASHMHIYAEVKATGLSNYLCAKIEIPSDIKCDAWPELLQGYHDEEIVN